MHTEDILCVLNNRLSRILKLQPQRCNDKPFSHKYTRKKEAFKRDVYECACMCAYEPFSASLVLPFLLAKCLPHTRYKRNENDQINRTVKNTKIGKKRTDWTMEKSTLAKWRCVCAIVAKIKPVQMKTKKMLIFISTVMGPMMMLLLLFLLFFHFVYFGHDSVLSPVVFLLQRTRSSFSVQKDSTKRQTSNWLRVRIYIVIWGQSV